MVEKEEKHNFHHVSLSVGWCMEYRQGETIVAVDYAIMSTHACTYTHVHAQESKHTHTHT